MTARQMSMKAHVQTGWRMSLGIPGETELSNLNLTQTRERERNV